MNGYKLTPRAEEGLLRTVNYVHINFGEAVAERVVDTIQEALERVALMPLTGHRRDDLTDDESIRFVSVGPTLIAYRHQDSPTRCSSLSAEKSIGSSCSIWAVSRSRRSFQAPMLPSVARCPV